MKVSVVVPAYNEEKLIGTSLRRINQARHAFKESGWESELVVCDNNSTDRTADVARGEGAKVVFEPVNQIARARNRGAEAATGDWLVFVDADSHPSRELFADVRDQIRRGDCLAGGCTVRLEQGPWIAHLVTQGWNLISRTCKWAAGSFIFCETGAFRQIGGFSQELFASEEIDLSRRLKRAARIRGKRFVILRKHSIVTSARKIHLYSGREHLRFFVRGLFRPYRTVRSRESCPTWYDGRR